MSCPHRLLGMRVGVPDPAALDAFYAELGLTAAGGAGTRDAADATADAAAGRGTGVAEVSIEERPVRQLLGVELGVAHEADLDAVADRLADLGAPERTGDGVLTVVDPVTEVAFSLRAAPPRVQEPPPAPPAANAPGAVGRRNRRAPAVDGAPRPPRRLGHLVLGSPDRERTRDLLVDGLGFRVSDEVPGIITFLRCSTDHHNVAVVDAPVPLLQHTSWECDDLDHVGWTATSLLRGDPGRHVWGIGRHFAGSNHYWYLRDPSGTFTELYHDLDVIDDDEAWEHERSARSPFHAEQVANAWGPDLPLEFVVPDDLADLQSAWAARTGGGRP